MLTYSFVDIGSKKLYEHLYECIKNDILSGSIPPKTRLPSKRAFAKNLGVSTVTVENAYEQLLAEGYIYSVPKSGFFASDIAAPIKKSAAPKISSVRGKAPEKYFADFVSNQTNPEKFPFSVWSKLMRGVILDKSSELMQNSPYNGIEALRTEICRYLADFRGISASPEQVFIGAGTEYLYGLLVQLLGYDKKYAVEDPGYMKVYQIYKSNNADCIFVPMDENGIDIDYIENHNADVLHISPSHHYPTGKIMPISRRYELMGWASKSDNRYIIEDDYDSEFRLMGNPIPSLQSIDVSEKVIYMNTFTKTLASTIRISYMVLPQHLISRFYDKLGFYSCTVSTFEQYTLAAFISQGYFEKHINRMRNYYRKKRDRIMSCINQSSLAGISKISEESSGLHFLLHIDTDMTDEEIVASAKKNGINAACLSHYFHNIACTCEHTIVINYSGIEDDRIEEAVSRLADSIKKQTKKMCRV